MVEGGAFGGNPLGRVSQCGKFIGTQSCNCIPALVVNQL